MTQTALPKASAGIYDLGPALRVQLIRRDLQSVSTEQILGGANLVVIGDGSAHNWEVFQFAQAEIIDADTFDLSLRLRGQAGTDGVTPAEWPEGSIFVLLNGVPEQIELASSARGVTQHFPFGPATRPLGDASYQYRTEAFSGIGFRPYSVVHLRGEVRGSDVDLAWIRRARVGGDNWYTEDVPLSEAFERYLCGCSKMACKCVSWLCPIQTGPKQLQCRPLTGQAPRASMWHKCPKPMVKGRWQGSPCLSDAIRGAQRS